MWAEVGGRGGLRCSALVERASAGERYRSHAWRSHRSVAAGCRVGWLGGLGLLIAQNLLLWWLMATGVLVVNALLSAIDESGILDWLALAGSVVVLGLVLAAWVSIRRS